jgi:hypothetical protein
MLTPEERAAIEAQEIFRHEVRLGIQGRHTTRPGFWRRLADFLERPIILWLLSTVVVGAVTFFYDQSVKRRSAEAGRVERIRDLDIEIAARLRSLDLLRKGGRDAEGRQLKAMLLLSVSDFGPLANMAQSESKQSAARRSLASLLWELESLVPAPEKEDVAQALVIAETINTIVSDNFMAMAQQEDLEVIADIAPLADKINGLKRWRTLEIGGRSFPDRLKAFQDDFHGERRRNTNEREKKEMEQEEAQATLDAAKEAEGRRIAAEAGALVALRSFQWSRRDDFESNFLMVEIENKSGRAITDLTGRAYARSQEGRWAATREFVFQGRFEPGQVLRLEQRLGYIEQNTRLANLNQEELSRLILAFYPHTVTFSDGGRINYDTSNFGFLYKRGP